MSSVLEQSSCCAPSTSASSCCGPSDAMEAVTTFTAREEALIVLAAAMTANNSESVREALIEAKQAGVTNDEIAVISDVAMALQGGSSCCGPASNGATVQQGSTSSCCQ